MKRALPSLRTLAAAAALLLAAQAVAAQDGGVLTGRVVGPDGPAAFARVAVVGTALETAANEDGRYRLAGVPAGTHMLLASVIGHETARVRVVVRAGGVQVVDFTLRRAAIAMNPLVVTGTMKQATVLESTVKVDVVPAAVLQRTVTNNLMESIQFVNGLSQQIDCGVCYTNAIRINGTEGPYTAVLIDGMPIMSSLASVYGLNGINPALIERIEILKGPSSTLYGTEALGGVVNVMTKSPRFTPRLAVEAYRTSHGETNLDVGITPLRGDVSGLLSGSFSLLDTFLDDNRDGFTDAPLWTRAALFGKLDVRRGERRTLELGAKLYYEDRFGGVEAWTPADRGSGTVYGESIQTRRAELVGRWLPPISDERLRADFSLTWHEQDSWYGATRYDATQGVAVGNVVWSAPVGDRHDVLAGASMRVHAYDDDTPATAEPERRLIPGIFVQDDWNAAPGVQLLGGLRLDHHAEHGLIAAPRASAKWQPFHDTTLRLNAGTGFRVVNLFTEDHAALTGAREVMIAERLRPERSWSITGNLNQVIEFGPHPMMIDVDAFYTRFSNKIIPDYDAHPDRIVYENLRGHSVSRGLALSLNQNVGFDRLLYTLGVTLQEVYAVEDGARSAELFAPRYTGVAGLTYSHPAPAFSLDYSARLTGPMALPEYDAPFRRPTRSRAWAVHDVKATVPVGRRARLYGGVNNLLDFTQGSPLIDPERPFGDAFDTAYVWGPLVGRRFVVGARWGVAR